MSYTRVNWIQSTKTYWDAGVAPGANPKIFADFEIIGLDGSQTQDVGIVGIFSPSHYSSPTFMMLACTGRTNFSVYVGGYNWVDYAGRYTFNQRWQGTLTTSSYSFINLDDHSYDSSGSITGNHTAGSSNYYIGAQATSTRVFTGGTYKWYEIILYENNVEVAHFLPYRDDETGYGVFYETVSGRYMPAYEPSAVIAGPPLYPEYTSTFTSDGGTDSYELETEESWTAASDSNWLIVSPVSGTGDETLSITVKKNSDLNSGRTGVVTVTDSGSNTLFVWTVEQERKKLVIKLMNLWKDGAPINKLIIDEDARYQSFANLGAVSGNTIEYTTTGGTMIQVPRTGWGSPLISNTYDNGGVLTFLGQPTAIAPNAFSGSDITTFSVPDSVSAIGANAFAECAEIEELTLGENISTIGAGAFSGCSNLDSIESNATTAPSISADTFYGVATGGTLKHPSGSDYSLWLSGSPYYLGYYEWSAKTASLPNYNHQFNINAKEFNSTTAVFPNGGSLGDIELWTSSLAGAGWTASTDYVRISGCSSQVYTVPAMDSPSALTVVMKGYPVKGGGSQYKYANFLAHRTGGNMNYMLRAFDNGGNGTNASCYWHLGSDSSTYASGGTCPEIYVWRHSGSTWEAKLYNEGTAVTRNGSYGSNSNKFILWAGYTDFKDGNPSSYYGESWYGDFYWAYCTTDFLTDEEVEQVVGYNESL